MGLDEEVASNRTGAVSGIVGLPGDRMVAVAPEFLTLLAPPPPYILPGNRHDGKVPERFCHEI